MRGREYERVEVRSGTGGRGAPKVQSDYLRGREYERGEEGDDTGGRGAPGMSNPQGSRRSARQLWRRPSAKLAEPMEMQCFLVTFRGVVCERLLENLTFWRRWSAKLAKTI